MIYAASPLRREAWRSLLSGQSEITVVGGAGDFDGAAGLLRRSPPLTVLIEEASP